MSDRMYCTRNWSKLTIEPMTLFLHLQNNGDKSQGIALPPQFDVGFKVKVVFLRRMVPCEENKAFRNLLRKTL